MSKADLKRGAAAASLTTLLLILLPLSPAQRLGLTAVARRGVAAPAAVRAAFLVTSTGDESDLSPGDGFCLTAGAVCTLRAAIEEANATAAADTITFAIPPSDTNCNAVSGVCTITPLSPLPAVSQPADIDGYSLQPGASPNTLAVGDNAQIKIELNGSMAGMGADGLRFTAGSSSLRGLAIYRFSGDGVELSGAGGNTIAGNFIGHTSAGATVTGVGNGANGIRVSNVGSNTIGGPNPADRNLIAQNGCEGVDITGASASGNVVAGNYIGTDRAGTGDFGNLCNGVFLAGPSNTVGGSTTTPGQGAGNVISGNASAGVRITSGGNSNTVAGNLIGTQAGGAAALRNDLEGVFITNTASGNTIGGASAGLRNIISGNNLSTGTDGVEINGAGTSSNTVAGNYIGLRIDGATALSNGGDGVRISGGASGNTVGGATAGARNVISGNTSSGVSSDGVELTGAGTTSNLIAGNYIGTDAGGTIDRGNSGDGVRISGGASGNTVGGSASAPGTAPGNLISGNNSDGVEINTGTASPTNNLVQGNLIGTTAAGTATLPNSFNGVLLSATSNNLIGGSTAEARNVICADTGAGDDGVDIQGGATGNVVAGNYIGTDINGEGSNAAPATDFGAGGDGVRIASGSSNNTVGGLASAPGQAPGNVIAGNNSDGVHITGADTGGNSVRGNLIGLRADGTTAYANGDNGVLVDATSGSNTVGGTAAGAANLIAGNTGDGVEVSGAAVATRVLTNSIHSNGALGIDLGGDGATANDPGDPDPGPNNLQNFPALAYASSVAIGGTLDSAAGATYRIEFFSNAACDPSGRGEGRTFLGALTGVQPGVEFSFTPGTALSAGEVVTATATNETTGDTSEFSACVAADVTPPTVTSIVREAGSANPVAAGSSVKFTVTFSEPVTGVDATDFDVETTGSISGASVTGVSPASGPAQTYTVTVNTGTGTGTVRLDVSDDDSIRDAAQNPLGGPGAGNGDFTSGETFTVQPALTVTDVAQAEGNAGTTTFAFTVRLSDPSSSPVTFDVATADGTATQSDSDYVPRSETAQTIPANETTYTFHVMVNGDTAVEPNETFFVNVANVSGAVATDPQGMGTILNDDGAPAAGEVIISEFRLRGPAPSATPTPGNEQGQLDEFIELYNNTDTEIRVVDSAPTGTGPNGWALVSSDAPTAPKVVIPNGTVIPARGHLLVANERGYSLNSYGEPDATYTADIPDGAGLALLRTADVGGAASTDRLDAVGFLPGEEGFYEGTPLSPAGGVTTPSQHSFLRMLDTGRPKDSGSNAQDFVLVSTNGAALNGAPSRLGAPGPEGRASPTERQGTVITLIAPCVGATSPPNRVRILDAGDPSTSTHGTLSIRRRVTNSTGERITRLRFRVAVLTTFPSPSGTADLRALNSDDDPNQSNPCGGTFDLRGLTREEPPAQSSGGGLNTSLIDDEITLAAPLEPGEWVDVDFLFGVQQTGLFRFFFNVEVLTKPAAGGAERPSLSSPKWLRKRK